MKNSRDVSDVYDNLQELRAMFKDVGMPALGENDTDLLARLFSQSERAQAQVEQPEKSKELEQPNQHLVILNDMDGDSYYIVNDEQVDFLHKLDEMGAVELIGEVDIQQIKVLE